MNVIKRNGMEVIFDRANIINAITKANTSVQGDAKLSDDEILSISAKVEKACMLLDRAVSVEEIQDMVETAIMVFGHYTLAKNYITYRYTRALARQSNTTDERILNLIDSVNEEAKQENSNKNPVVISTQRDYMAGEVSRDLTERILLPADIVEAHRQGIIHFHDSDYFAQHSHNCDLINLEDMLQNGTVISGTKIETPHSFSTACNIATQIVAQVASNQYGGQTFSLAHLAPFVDVSRRKIRERVLNELEYLIENNGIPAVPNMTSKPIPAGKEEFYKGKDLLLQYFSAEDIEHIVEGRVKTEIKSGVQTIQYQILTLLTTNGQTPFVTTCMYLGEAKDDQTKNDLALIIEETLKQRIQGVKNETGAWITPSFPKLVMVLEPDIIDPDTKYHYLYELAAKCTAKRMVPDYVSEKVMIANKIDSNGNGNCYPPMGCRSFLTPWVDPETGKAKFYGRLTKEVKLSLNHVNAVNQRCA